jgi:hypothetical protein
MDTAVVGSAVSPLQPAQLLFEDGLGERRYGLGALNEPLTTLRLSSVVSSVSSFDFALRERAARLSGFRHESYGRVRSVEVDRRTSALLILSEFTPGHRLSTLLADAEKRSLLIEINVVRAIMRQLVVGAAALQEAVPEICHGALGPERLIVTPAGQVMIVEYVLGAALEQLGHSRARYWRELRVALPGPPGTPLFDPRTDVTQLGTVALALLLGRPLMVDEYPDRLYDLIQAASVRSVIGTLDPLPPSLRDWLLRALQLDQTNAFASPLDARAALDAAFGEENAAAEMGALQVFLARHATADAPGQADLGPRLEAMRAFLARYPARRTTEQPQPPSAKTSSAAPPQETTRVPVAEPIRVETLLPAAPEPALIQEPVTPAPSYVEERRSATPVIAWSNRTRIAALAGAAALAIIALGAFLYFRSGGEVATGSLEVGTNPQGIAIFIDGAPHGVTPLKAQLPPGQHVIELRTDTERRRIPITLSAGSQVSQYLEFARTPSTSGELLVRTDPAGANVSVDGTFVGRSPVSVSDLSPGTHTVVMQHDAGTLTERVLIETGRTASLVVPLGAAQKSAAAGWVRLDVPADVQVFENGRFIGSSEIDRIMLPIGRHDLELVNEALGYRARRTVQVTAGQTSSIRPEWPRGSMALNAVPWAEVFVDNERVGETPIGSVTVPIGTHEVVFRHPELGERRRTVTVTTAAEPLKVGMDFRAK